jgi:hypothetical protein
MKRFLPAALLLAAGSAACDRSPTGPTVAEVVVSPSAHSLNVGATVQLAAQARSASGQVLTGVTPTWSTLDPQVASVSGGLVTGLAAGTARIVAAAQGRADTAVITVLAAIGGSCEPGMGLGLAVGAHAVLSGAQAGLLCLEGGAGGADYLVVPFHGTTARAATLAVQVQGSALVAASGPPSPSVSPFLSAGADAHAHEGRRADDGGFHLRLNQRHRAELGALVPAARAREQARRDARFSVAHAVPATGSLMNLNVQTSSACQNPDVRVGRVAAVSQRAIIVADTANPRNGLTDADYQAVAATFDTLVWPVNVAAFGAPADIDRNERVVIFYTRAVNELTPAGANYVVGGFFFGRDLFPAADCAGSNEAEMFYMLAADPDGEVNGNRRSLDYVRGTTVGTVGHEFQHLVSASRRIYLVDGVTGTQWNEEVWLNEGLSHIAEELLFYRRAGLAPGSNLGAEIYLSGTRSRTAFDEFGIANILRLRQWMLAPESDSPYDAAGGQQDDLATRGAIWSFLRYAADRRGGTENQLWQRLIDNHRTGLANLQFAFGEDPIPLFRDWAVAQYVDDAVPGVAAALRQPSWNFRSLYPAVTGSFPLRVRQLSSGAPLNLTLVAGGSAYLRAGVAGGELGTVRFTSGEAAPPATFSAVVVRTR